MSFLTTILRRSGDYWVALCLENGVVSQGFTKEEALYKNARGYRISEIGVL